MKPEIWKVKQLASIKNLQMTSWKTKKKILSTRPMAQKASKIMDNNWKMLLLNKRITVQWWKRFKWSIVKPSSSCHLRFVKLLIWKHLLCKDLLILKHIFIRIWLDSNLKWNTWRSLLEITWSRTSKTTAGSGAKWRQDLGKAIDR